MRVAEVWICKYVFRFLGARETNWTCMIWCGQAGIVIRSWNSKHMQKKIKPATTQLAKARKCYCELHVLRILKSKYCSCDCVLCLAPQTASSTVNRWNVAVHGQIFLRDVTSAQSLNWGNSANKWGRLEMMERPGESSSTRKPVWNRRMAPRRYFIHSTETD